MDEKKQVLNKKRNGSFNVLDFLIIVVVLFVIAVAVMLTIPKIRQTVQAGEKVTILYTVVFENVDENVYNKIKLDQTVIESNSGSLIGTVSEPPESEPSYEYVLKTDASGNREVVKKQSDNGEKNIIVTITTEAVYNEGTGFTVEGYRIAVGKQMDLRFADFIGTGYCDGISVMGNK